MRGQLQSQTYLLRVDMIFELSPIFLYQIKIKKELTPELGIVVFSLSMPSVIMSKTLWPAFPPTTVIQNPETHTEPVPRLTITLKKLRNIYARIGFLSQGSETLAHGF